MTNSLDGTINQTLQIVVRCLIWLLTQITAYLMHINGTTAPSNGIELIVNEIGNGHGKQKLSRCSGHHQTTEANDSDDKDNITTEEKRAEEEHQDRKICKVSIIMHHIHCLIYQTKPTSSGIGDGTLISSN